MPLGSAVNLKIPQHDGILQHGRQPAISLMPYRIGSPMKRMPQPSGRNAKAFWTLTVTHAPFFRLQPVARLLKYFSISRHGYVSCIRPLPSGSPWPSHIRHSERTGFQGNSCSSPCPSGHSACHTLCNYRVGAVEESIGGAGMVLSFRQRIHLGNGFIWVNYSSTRHGDFLKKRRLGLGSIRAGCPAFPIFVAPPCAHDRRDAPPQVKIRWPDSPPGTPPSCLC